MCPGAAKTRFGSRLKNQLIKNVWKKFWRLLKFAAPDAVERDSKIYFSEMNTIAEHRGVLMEDVRRKATFVTRLVEIRPRRRLLMNAVIGVILFLSPALRAEAADEVKVTDLGGVKVTDLMTKDLVKVPGKEVTMITVEYAPGGADPVHRHNASAFVYVLEGSIVMQMKGGEKVTLHPGDTFYEDPEGIHLVGKNASDTKPAKFLVVLVKEKGAPILTPVNE
jgi:quercetin dioxygenase-like cupin family protein